MPSVIPGYEYDIFISYRQKDNRHDGWVTRFVESLKDELESAFKEEISVYFDINPHDGLLETHDVGASLKEKLKCLIFIPVISRTYCDPKSFAWQHEFKAFIENASQDRYGLKIRLPNGNIASRVLPIRIHDLEKEDIRECEILLGSVLRGIEFIYREPGVNRPLKEDDNEKANLNKTLFRNQINKTSNAIRDLISGMRAKENATPPIHAAITKSVLKSPGKKRFLIIGAVLMMIALTAAGLTFLPGLFKPGAEIEKSIAVLPFVNMSNDPQQEYFAQGIREEILNNLYMVGGLILPSSTSALRFKASRLGVRDIARQLNVNYLLEGNVSKFGNEARIIVRLIDGKSEQVIWSQPYKRSLTAIDLLEIQSDIAQQVAKTLDIALNSSVKQRMAFIPTESSEAYDLYLQGIDRTLTFSKSEQLLKSSISIDSGFADAYSALAVLNIWEGGHNGKLTRDDVINKVNPLLAKAFQLDENSVRAHLASAALKLYYYWDFKGVEKEMEIITRISPGDYENLSWFTDFLLASGKLDEALEVETRKFKYSQTEITGFVSLALALYFNNQQDKSNEILKKAWQIFGNNQFLILNSVRIYDYTGRYQDAIDMYEKHYRDTIPFYKIPYFCGHLGVAFFKTGNKEKSGEYLDELLARSQKTAIGSPAFFAAAIYTSMGDKVNAIRLLDQAYRNKEVELYWLKVDPLFRSLHDEPGFRDLIRKMGL